MSPLIGDAAQSQNRFQEHLHPLLSVEADYAIRHLSIGEQARGGGLFPALQKTSRYLPRLRHPEEPCLP